MGRPDEESVIMDAIDGSVGWLLCGWSLEPADAPPPPLVGLFEVLSVREPKGAVLALVAVPLPSRPMVPLAPKRRFRVPEELVSPSLEA